MPCAAGVPVRGTPGLRAGARRIPADRRVAITAKEPGSCYVFKITGVAHKDELDKEVVDWHASDEYFVRAQWFAVVGDNDTDDGAGSLRLSYYDATLELTVALNRISGSRDLVRARGAFDM